MCTYVSDRAMCRGRLYICKYYAFISLTIFRIFVFTLYIWHIILIYPHISSDTSTYWSLRHLQACGCLINSLLVWFDYLYPVCHPPHPVFLENDMAGSEDGTKYYHSFITTFSPFCITDSSQTLLIEPPLVSLHWEEMWTGGQSRRQKKRRNVGFALLDGLWPTSLTLKLYVHLFQTLKGRLLFSLKQGMNNYQTENQRWLWKLLHSVTTEWLSCLGMSCGLKFHFIFITHRTRIIAPRRATSYVPFGPSEYPK